MFHKIRFFAFAPGGGVEPPRVATRSGLVFEFTHNASIHTVFNTILTSFEEHFETGDLLLIEWRREAIVEFYSAVKHDVGKLLRLHTRDNAAIVILLHKLDIGKRIYIGSLPIIESC